MFALLAFTLAVTLHEDVCRKDALHTNDDEYQYVSCSNEQDVLLLVSPLYVV